MKGHNEIELEYGNHLIVYSTTQPLLISADDEPIKALGPGSGKFYVKGYAGKLSVNATNPKERYALNVTTHKTQPGEELNDEEPPAPPPANSYLAKLRQRVQQQMITSREAFAEHRSIYEMVDDLDTFEEDRVRQLAPSEFVSETDTTEEVTSETVTSSKEASD